MGRLGRDRRQLKTISRKAASETDQLEWCDMQTEEKCAFFRGLHQKLATQKAALLDPSDGRGTFQGI